MRSITPQWDWLIVRQVKTEEQKTPGGLVLPDQKKDVETECEVLEAGPGRLTEAGAIVPMSVKKGDRILFVGAGSQFTVDGHLVGCIREGQVVCVLGPATRIVKAVPALVS